MLRSYTVRGLIGINTGLDQSDAALGYFQNVEGLYPYPVGGFSSPAWDGRTGTFSGSDDSNVISIATKLPILVALVNEDDTKAHFVRIRFNNNSAYDLICVWSLQEDKPLGIWPVQSHWTGEALTEAGQYKTPVSAVTSVTLLASDFDPSLRWYMSRISDRLYFGNGADQNQRYIKGSEVFEALTARNDPEYEDYAQVDFPACTSFAMGQNREIYATGNAAKPLRMWTTAKPGDQFVLFEGLRNLETSYTDITLPGSTKITALSVWNNYISVHTDAGVVNLFGHGNTTDGYTADQRPSATAAGAANPDCVKDDSDGFGSFYLGDDNQLYKDEAIRGAPFSKRFERRIDSPIARYGQWNTRMKPYADGEPRQVVYDRQRSLTYIWALVQSGQLGCWCYNEATTGITGPVTLFNPCCITSVTLAPKGYTMQIGMNSLGVLYFDTGPSESTIAQVESGTDLDFQQGIPELSARSGFSVATKQTEVPADTYPAGLFAERLDGDLYRKVFGHDTLPDGDSPYDDDFSSLGDFSSWGKLDTGFIDLGDDTVEKTFREVRLSIDMGNPVSTHCLIVNDLGHHRIVSRSVIASENQHVFRFNLRGRRVRIVCLIGYFISRPITIRAFELRYLPGRVRSR